MDSTPCPTGVKRLRCIIIGAGVSGILMAYKLQTHLRDHIEFRIFEKSPELGGTWYENKYPGCACDVPSHIYQYPFAPNPNWSKFYATSDEIQAYLKSVCSQFGLDRYITYNSAVTSARWHDDSGTWTVDVSGTAAGGTHTCEVLINAGGILNHYKMPSIPGLASFKGPVLHTAAWDPAADLAGKRVAIIGAGASAVQVLPAIQPRCASVSIFIRTPSWICPPAGLPHAADQDPNPVYTAADKQRFKEDAAFSLRTRKAMEDHFNGMFAAFFKASPEQRDMRARFEAYMRGLIPDEGMRARLIPTFEAGCRRINPSAPYLVALQKPNVRAVFDPIVRITERGVEVAAAVGAAEESDGSGSGSGNSSDSGGSAGAATETYPADVLIAATGFDTSFRPRFPIVGRGGVDLRDLWAADPVSYMGTGVSGFPNYLMFLGPNTPISNGSLMGSLEATSDYFVRILTKVCRERVKSFDVTEQAQRDFSEHTQGYMKDMVWSGTCRSWFKRDISGHVSALWPGSSLHYIQTLAEDRWQDYAWTYHGNRFSYWSAGLSWIEKPQFDPLGVAQAEARTSMRTLPHKGADLSFYLLESDSWSAGETCATTKT